MSICPNCRKRVKKGSGNKKKVKRIWMHKACPLTPEELRSKSGVLG